MFAQLLCALLKYNKAKQGLCQIASTQTTPVYHYRHILEIKIS